MRVNVGGSLVWRGTRYQVVFVRGDSAGLCDDDGAEVEVSVDEIVRSAQRIESWTRKLAEVSYTAQEPDPSMDPWQQAVLRIESERVGKLVDAIAAEAEWLSSRLGKPVSARSVERYLHEYRRHGTRGLPGGRGQGFSSRRRSSVDPRVVEAINHVLGGRKHSSTTSRAVVINQVSQRVRQLHGDGVKIPSRSTFYRLLDQEDRGRFSFGSAKTRESLALQPDRAFGTRTALLPGELVEMDSTQLDVMMRFDDMTIGRPELTILLDVATRSILAALLRPVGTKSVDLLVALARALVPYSRRFEGARETRRLVSTAWAEDALIDQEEYERVRVAQPFIFPETITTDRGRNYLSRHFRAVCEALNINLISSAPHTPTDKPHVERAFGSINSLFLQYMKGYVGRSVEHRGREVESQSAELLTIAQGQELLEDWIAVEWQNKSHNGLRDPLHPTIKLSPNEMCRAFREFASELHVPLAREDYIALLPVQYRAINRYGVTIDHRVYNSERLNGMRRQKSDDKGKNGRWPIRVDPYNLHVIWLESDEEFIPLRWANETHELPLLGDVWRYARMEYGERDGAADLERGPLIDAMKAFAGAGNPEASRSADKRNARQRARSRAVASDPMNMTRADLDVDDATPVISAADDISATEDWPHSGGFPFIGDALDGVRKRLDE